MDVVILCGGNGTRLSEETAIKPKPMVNIGEIPILLHIMKIYSHYGYKRFILALGYKGEYIKKYFHNYKIAKSDINIKLGSTSHIDYLNHLEEDLNGERGDIDILIDKNDLDFLTKIIEQYNFFIDLSSNGPFYYMGIDKDTHKFIMLDVNTKIQFGPKPYKPYSFLFTSNELDIITDGVKILNKNDYIPLMF